MTTLPALDGVQDTHATVAEEFLDYLSPRHKLWSPWKDTSWIFRGQGGAEWNLLPKAYRGRAPFDELGLRGIAFTDKSKAPEWTERSKLVDEMLERFVDRVNRSGLPVPVAFPKKEDRVAHGESNALPWTRQWPQLALAQHHGLPTPLLDWTRRPYVAAYFAAYTVAEALRLTTEGDEAFSRKLKAIGTHLAVWGAVRVRRDFFAGIDPARAAAALGHLGGYHLEFYDPPAATNPNLHAQQGTFSIFMAKDDPPLESLYACIAKLTGSPYLKRVTLPVAEAPKLLRLLAEEGIDGASLFPSVDGVVRAMKEGRFRDFRP